MAYAWVQDVPIGEGAYRRIAERLGDEPTEGPVLHLAILKEDGKLRYVDVWKSKELCDKAFDERIHPAVSGALREAGIRPGGEPARQEVTVVEPRGAALGVRS